MKTFALKLTGAIALEGQLKRAGEIIIVDEPTAKNLLHRGKAVVPADADQATAAPAGDDQGEQKPAGKASDGLTVQQLKDALQAKGLPIPEGAKKADLAALLDAAAAAA